MCCLSCFDIGEYITLWTGTENDLVTEESAAFWTGFVSAGGLKAFDCNCYFTALQNECLQWFTKIELEYIAKCCVFCLQCKKTEQKQSCVISRPKELFQA